MIRRVRAWARRRWSLSTDTHGTVESAELSAAFLVAAVRAGVARCADHPDVTAVTVVLRDGVPVALCAGHLDLAGTHIVRRSALRLIGSREDGATSCHQGRGDCWGGAEFTHRRVVSCVDLQHGRGRCDVVRGMGVDAEPARPVDTSCARCGKRLGVVLVAASGSFPTSVCQRCADAIAEGRVMRGGGVMASRTKRLERKAQLARNLRRVDVCESCERSEVTVRWVTLAGAPTFVVCDGCAPHPGRWAA